MPSVTEQVVKQILKTFNSSAARCQVRPQYFIYPLVIKSILSGAQGISLPSHWALSAYVELTLWPRVGGSMKFAVEGTRKG